jgi:hypothetical protein
VGKRSPVAALVPPQRAAEEDESSIGLAACAGALANEWDVVDEDMAEIVAVRQQVSDVRLRILRKGYCFDTDVLSATIRPALPLYLIRRATVPPQEQFEAVASLWARRELDGSDVYRPGKVGGVEFTAQIGNSLVHHLDHGRGADLGRAARGT